MDSRIPLSAMGGKLEGFILENLRVLRWDPPLPSGFGSTYGSPRYGGGSTGGGSLCFMSSVVRIFGKSWVVKPSFGDLFNGDDFFLIWILIYHGMDG